MMSFYNFLNSRKSPRHKSFDICVTTWSWHDLDDNEGIDTLHVYAWQDPVNQRFIVEWDNIANGQHDEDCELDIPDSCPRHTFQLILDDSNVGNGEIIFQYKEAESWYVDDHGSTVGIEAPD